MKSKPLPPPRVPAAQRSQRETERPPVSLPEPFSSEPPTRQKNVTASVYQSLLSVFDEMTAQQRMEFVEFAARYATLDGPTRRGLLELMPAYGDLSDADRDAISTRVAELVATRRVHRPRER